MRNDDRLADSALILESLFPRSISVLFQLENDPLRDRPLGQIKLMRALFERDRSCSELKEHLGISASSLTQMAGRLVSSGLVNKYGIDGDGRTRMLRLSRTGRAMMRERQELRAAAARQALSNLSGQEVDRLIEALQTLTLGVQLTPREREAVH